MSQRTLLIIFAVATVVLFGAWRLFVTTTVQMGGVTAGVALLVGLFVVGAIAAPYLDR